MPDHQTYTLTEYFYYIVIIQVGQFVMIFFISLLLNIMITKIFLLKFKKTINKMKLKLIKCSKLITQTLI